MVNRINNKIIKNDENKKDYAIDVHGIGCDCKSGIFLM